MNHAPFPPTRGRKWGALSWETGIVDRMAP